MLDVSQPRKTRTMRGTTCYSLFNATSPIHREGDEKKKAYRKEDTRRWSLAGELAGMAFDSREEALRHSPVQEMLWPEVTRPGGQTGCRNNGASAGIASNGA